MFRKINLYQKLLRKNVQLKDIKLYDQLDASVRGVEALFGLGLMSEAEYIKISKKIDDFIDDNTF